MISLRDILKENSNDRERFEFWRDLNLQKLSVSGNKCEVCNGTSEIKVHLKTRRISEYCDTNDLVLLCEPCHKKFHQALRINNTTSWMYSTVEIVSLIKKYRDSGFRVTEELAKDLLNKSLEKCFKYNCSRKSLEFLAKDVEDIYRKMKKI